MHPTCVRLSLVVVLLLAGACAEVDERALVPPQEGFGDAPVGAPAKAPVSTSAASSGPSSVAPSSASAAASPPRPSELPTSRAPHRPSPTTDGGDDEPVVVEDPTLSATERGVLRAVALCLRKEKPLPGSLALELTLEADGSVRDVSFGPGYSPALKSCVEPRVKAVRYPAQPEGGLRVLRIPINETETTD